MPSKMPERALLKVPENRTRNRIRLAAKLLLIAAFIVITNAGFGERVSLLLDNERYNTLLPFLAIWGMGLVAIVIAAFQPNVWVRMFWTMLIALSSAVAWGYHSASQSEFTVFDIVSLWNARHEAGRAAEFYGSHIGLALVVLASGILLMALPVGIPGKLRRWFGYLFWFPAVPVAVIAAVVFLKGGGGSQAMPTQFAPVALTSLASAKIALQGAQVRHAVAWRPANTAPSKTSSCSSMKAFATSIWT